MSDEQEENWEDAHEYREKCHAVINQSNEKIESIITQISSVFIGAIASFVAIINAPLQGSILLALILLILCIILTCSSYLMGAYASKFAQASADLRKEGAERKCDWYISHKLDKIRDVIDQIVPMQFIVAIIIASFGIYNEYSIYIINKTNKEKTEMITEKNCNNSSQSVESTKGLAVPLKEIRPSATTQGSGNTSTQNSGSNSNQNSGTSGATK